MRSTPGLRRHQGSRHRRLLAYRDIYKFSRIRRIRRLPHHSSGYAALQLNTATHRRARRAVILAFIVTLSHRIVLYPLGVLQHTSLPIQILVMLYATLLPTIHSVFSRKVTMLHSISHYTICYPSVGLYRTLSLPRLQFRFFGVYLCRYRRCSQ